MIASNVLSVALSFCLLGAQASAGVYNYHGNNGYAGYTRSKESPPHIKPTPNYHKLLPIRAEHLFPQLRKRSNELSNLHPEDTATLYFGKPAGGYNIHLATINATRQDPEHPILALEKFDALTKSITCRGRDIMLEFRDTEVLAYAVKKWDWVNRNNSDYFFLVSEHHYNGCNPKDERKAHKVNNVKYNERNLTMVLTLESTTWDEALGDFTFSFETIRHPAVNLAKRRDPEEVGFSASPFSIIAADLLCAKAKWLGWNLMGCKENGDFSVGKALSEPAKAALKNMLNVMPEFDAWAGTTIDWGKDDLNNRLVLIEGTGTLPPGGGVTSALKIQSSCVGCYLKGNLEYSVSGGRNKDTKKAELVVVFQPKIKGRIQLEVSGKLDASKEFNYMSEFVSKALKAYVIEGIIALEPQFLNGPGIAMKAGVQGNFTVGFDMDTGSSVLTMKANSDGKVEVFHKNWDTFKANPILHAGTIKARSEVNPYIRLGVGLGAKLFSGSAVNATLGVWAGLNPQIVSKLDLGYDTDGLCSNKPELGAKFDTYFKVDYGYSTTAKLESPNQLATFLVGLVTPQGWTDSLNKKNMGTLYEKTHNVCKILDL